MENWANCPNIIGTGWSLPQHEHPKAAPVLSAVTYFQPQNTCHFWTMWKHVWNQIRVLMIASLWWLDHDNFGWAPHWSILRKKTSVSNFNAVYHLPGSFSVFILPRTGISRWKKALQSQYAIYGVCRSVQHTSGKLMLQQGANQCPPHIPSKGHHLGADSSKTFQRLERWDFSETNVLTSRSSELINQQKFWTLLSCLECNLGFKARIYVVEIQVGDEKQVEVWTLQFQLSCSACSIFFLPRGYTLNKRKAKHILYPASPFVVSI